MGDETDRDVEKGRLSDQLKLADDIRRFEITHFWTRSLFFAGILAAVFSGMREARKDDLVVAAILWSLGLICALAWSLANRGSKYWQERWEPYGLDSQSSKIPNQMPKFAWGKAWRWRAAQFSPSRMALAVSDSTFFAWVGMGIAQLLPKSGCAKAVAITIVIAFALVWCGVMLCRGRGDDPAEHIAKTTAGAVATTTAPAPTKTTQQPAEQSNGS